MNIPSSSTVRSRVWMAVHREIFCRFRQTKKRSLSWLMESGLPGAGVIAGPTFIESLLCARHSFKCFTSVN